MIQVTHSQLKVQWIARLLSSICVIAAIASSTLAEHPFHNSIAEMEWNKESKVFEIALSVWPVDLEKVLKDSREIREQLKSTINIDDPNQHPVLDPEIQKYVDSKLRAEFRGKPLKMKWLGFEVEKDSVWCYFEWVLPENKPETASDDLSSSWTLNLSNELFFELQDDQQNSILFQQTGQRRAVHFTKDHPRQKLDWDPTASSKM
jgi:hypothetical protein